MSQPIFMCCFFSIDMLACLKCGVFANVRKINILSMLLLIQSSSQRRFTYLHVITCAD